MNKVISVSENLLEFKLALDEFLGEYRQDHESKAAMQSLLKKLMWLIAAIQAIPAREQVYYAPFLSTKGGQLCANFLYQFGKHESQDEKLVQHGVTTRMLTNAVRNTEDNVYLAKETLGTIPKSKLKVLMTQHADDRDKWVLRPTVTLKQVKMIFSNMMHQGVLMAAVSLAAMRTGLLIEALDALVKYNRSIPLIIDFTEQDKAQMGYDADRYSRQLTEMKALYQRYKVLLPDLAVL